MKLSSSQRTKISGDAAKALTEGHPDILATACPLCKKSFSGVTSTRVADISELVAESLNVKLTHSFNPVSLRHIKEEANI
jgi:Fe-S oxidoreductase